jgi:hypothetical protein
MVSVMMLELILGVVCQIGIVSWSCEDVGNIKHRNDRKGFLNTAIGRGGSDHTLGQDWVQRELRHLEATVGHFTLIIQSTEIVKLFKGAHQGLGRWRVHVIEVNNIVNS